MTIRSRSEFIIKGDIFKVLISLIIPMSIGMFALLVINLVDAFYIGKLGVMELSAISFAFLVSADFVDGRMIGNVFMQKNI